MNKNKLNKLSLSAQVVVRAVLKTRNLPALSNFVKSAIARRDQLAGRSDDEAELKFDKITEKKSRTRCEDLCAAIASLEDAKDVSVVCGLAIKQRRQCRASAKARAAKSAS